MGLKILTLLVQDCKITVGQPQSPIPLHCRTIELWDQRILTLPVQDYKVTVGQLQSPMVLNHRTLGL